MCKEVSVEFSGLTHVPSFDIFLEAPLFGSAPDNAKLGGTTTHHEQQSYQV
jgi:hypothetical protein